MQGSVFDVTLSKTWFELSKTLFDAKNCLYICDKDAFIYIVRNFIFNNVAGNETKQQFGDIILNRVFSSALT